MIFSGCCNFPTTLSAVVLLSPLSWPFVLCVSCRLATWLYRLFLAAFVFWCAFLVCSRSSIGSCWQPHRGGFPRLLSYSDPEPHESESLQSDSLPHAKRKRSRRRIGKKRSAKRPSSTR
ncbi:putative cell division cycle regulator protein [Ixodes scapularis]